MRRATPNRPRLAGHVLALALVLFGPQLSGTTACASAKPVLAPVELGTWKKTSFGFILPPRTISPDEDGGVDLVFHFHAGMMAEKDWRAIGANAVVASATFGMGSGAYDNAFANPDRFGHMVDETLRAAASSGPGTGGPALRPRRIALVGWSAGYGSVSRILKQRYYDAVDTVILLDAPHGAYDHDRRVALGSIAPFVRFARDAVQGKKLMVVTHSSIVPPGYPSTTETARALFEAVAASERSPRETYANMDLLLEVDRGDFHVRGFSGTTAPDHIRHLHLVDEVFTQWVLPHWSETRALRRASL